jgi:hypothetical protein
MFVLLVAGRSWADDLPHVRPEELGFSTNRLEDIDKYSQQSWS